MQEEDSRPVFIYALMDPVTGEARYIGQTRRSLAWRLSMHLSSQVGKARVAWIDELREQGLRPTIIELETTDRAHAAERENWQIADHRARGCALTNARRASPTRKVNPEDVRPRRRRDAGEELTWNVMLRLPRSSRRGIERKARQTRTPVAVLLRSWVLERAAQEGAERAP